MLEFVQPAMKDKVKPKGDKPVVNFAILDNVENHTETSGKFRTKCASFRIPGQDSGGASTIYIPYCDKQRFSFGPFLDEMRGQGAFTPPEMGKRWQMVDFVLYREHFHDIHCPPHCRGYSQRKPSGPKQGNKEGESSFRGQADWFGIVVPLLISFGLSVIIVNNDSAGVLIGSWAGLAIALGWCLFKVVKPFAWRPWQKSIPILLAPLLVGGFGYGKIRERLKPSFVFVIPGVVLNGDSWDFVVNHRGPKTSYSTQILVQDNDRLEHLRQTKQNLTPEDVSSYQILLSIPEVNPKGRGSIFAKQFQWKPFNFENSRLTAEITWRDGGAHEEIRIARIQNKWKYAISVDDKETGKSLFRCKDDGFPASDPQPLPPCFPGINSSD